MCRRTGDNPEAVFHALLRRGQVVIHASEVERTAAPARPARPATSSSPTLAIRSPNSTPRSWVVTTARGERIGVGDRVATRRNDPALQVANRQAWTVTGIGQDGSLILHGPGRDRQIPTDYATRFVELAYATTVHGARGETVDPRTC